MLALSLLLLAATDTTSASITRVIQLLAEHQEMQETLRRELLDATTHAGRTLFDLDYDGFAKLPYLEAVVRETIRMYVPLLVRGSRRWLTSGAGILYSTCLTECTFHALFPT